MSDENNIPLRQEMFCSPLSVLSRFCHNSPQKRLRNFLRGDIMRKLRGRGSAGRAMRSQRIGQGFESPRLHQKMRQRHNVSAAFFSWRRIGERTCALACIFVMTTAPAQYRCLHPLCAGSAACAARRFRLDETFFQCLHRDIYGTLPSLRTYGEAPLVFIVARGLCGAHIRSTVPCAALPSLSQG